MDVVELVWETRGARADDLPLLSERGAGRDFCFIAIPANTDAKPAAPAIPAKKPDLRLPFVFLSLFQRQSLRSIVPRRDRPLDGASGRLELEAMRLAM
jgi:hypothetical protein